MAVTISKGEKGGPEMTLKPSFSALYFDTTQESKKDYNL
jgi:hypothetical protein